MMTPKEALLKDGTIPVKEGRGRLSREAIERCKELVSQGWAIKGYEVAAVKPSSSTAAPVAPVVNKVKAANGVKEVLDFTILWPEANYKAVNALTGKVLGDGKFGGMREVCNTCRVSLVQNQCEHPTILGGIPVKIVPR